MCDIVVTLFLLDTGLWLAAPLVSVKLLNWDPLSGRTGTESIASYLSSICLTSVWILPIFWLTQPPVLPTADNNAGSLPPVPLFEKCPSFTLWQQHHWWPKNMFTQHQQIRDSTNKEKTDTCPVKLEWHRKGTFLSITPEDGDGWSEWAWPLPAQGHLGIHNP